jgi:transposase
MKRGRPYSQDLRERVFAAADDGVAVGEIAALLRVSVSYVSKVLRRRKRTGETTTRPQRGHLQPKLAAFYEEIRQRVKDQPDATIAELQLWLRQAHRMSASTGLICETLALLGLTRKKRRSRMDTPRSPSESDAAALVAGARANLAVFFRERGETAEILRTSWNAIERSRELIARSRDVSGFWPRGGSRDTLATGR